MIRLALAFLGLSAGAVSAQGMVPTAPIVETCGGTRLVLAADGAAVPDERQAAAESISARVGGLTGRAFNYTDVVEGQLVLSLPEAFNVNAADLARLFDRVEFAFYDVDQRVVTGADIILQDGQRLVQNAAFPDESYVVVGAPVLTAREIESASASFDSNGAPAVMFSMTPEGTGIFADYTAAHIGEPFAIVLNGEVLTAPIIQSKILGGSGMITGSYTVEDTNVIAAVLQGGVLAFDFEIVDEIRVDGSEPSADFCP